MEKPAPISHKESQVGDWYTTFQMDRLVSNVSMKTLELYENAWKFFGPDLDEVMVGTEDAKGKRLKGDARQRAERAVLDAMKISRAKAKLKGRDISATSINIYGKVMCTFLNFLKKEGIFENRFKLDPIEEETGLKRKWFRDDEVKALQNYRPKTFNQTRAWTIAMYMLDTGVRIDEALDLKPDDIDMYSEVIRVRGKGGKIRQVPMSTMFRQILYRYTQKTAPDFPYVFGTRNGNKMLQSNSLRDIHVVERKAKVRELSWHCYRHTMATGYLRRGGDIYKLQRILGHADLKTTTVYLHLMSDYFTEGHDSKSSLMPITKRKIA